MTRLSLGQKYLLYAVCNTNQLRITLNYWKQFILISLNMCSGCWRYSREECWGPSVWMTSLPTSCAALIALISHGGGGGGRGGDWIPPAPELSHTCAFVYTHAHGNITHVSLFSLSKTLILQKSVSLTSSYSQLTDPHDFGFFLSNSCGSTQAIRLCMCLYVLALFKIGLVLCLCLQASLNKLMETLGQSEPYFVKCIRSNAEKVQCAHSRLKRLGLVFKAFFISFWSLNFLKAVYHFPLCSSVTSAAWHFSFSVIFPFLSSITFFFLFLSCPWGLMITWCWGSCDTQVCWRLCASASRATTSSTASR